MIEADPCSWFDEGTPIPSRMIRSTCLLIYHCFLCHDCISRGFVVVQCRFRKLWTGWKFGKMKYWGTCLKKEMKQRIIAIEVSIPNSYMSLQTHNYGWSSRRVIELIMRADSICLHSKSLIKSDSNITVNPIQLMLCFNITPKIFQEQRRTRAKRRTNKSSKLRHLKFKECKQAKLHMGTARAFSSSDDGQAVESAGDRPRCQLAERERERGRRETKRLSWILMRVGRERRENIKIGPNCKIPSLCAFFLSLFLKVSSVDPKVQ